MDFIYQKLGWQLVHRHSLPGRAARRRPIDGLHLSGFTRRFASNHFPGGIYHHQYESIRRFLEGDHVCLTTGTASGKSAVFYFSGLETLIRDPEARVLAIYPLKALGTEQEERWKHAVHAAGLKFGVGRIDGSVRTEDRLAILRANRIVIATPDVLHAWMLFHLDDPAIRRFLARLRLIIVDEVHTYSGVFGSNAAFLFRRIAHACALLGGGYRYLAASATIQEPGRHLEQLFGMPFALVGPELDSSPKHPVDIDMVIPRSSGDFLSEVTALLRCLAAEGGTRFLAFVDSRKQTEMISSILARGSTSEDSGITDPPEDAPQEEVAAAAEDHDTGELFDPLEHLHILPYRAGYEERDRQTIQRRLATGRLRGVVSTSALELGIDIPDLDVAVLVGVPSSHTSFYQRIGRIGRHRRGRVILIHSGSVLDNSVFRHPEDLMARPLAEGALYLENHRIQYIHALCLARPGGEHDAASGCSDPETGTFTLTERVTWPHGFAALCELERLGQVPRELQQMKMEAGDQPNYVFPLRDVETQFRVQSIQSPNRDPLGQLSHAQALREAYPGAVYYYATRPYRVVSIRMSQKVIQVRPESRYFTTPIQRPTLVFPMLSEETVYSGKRYGHLIAVESDLQIDEAVTGLKERRGSKEIKVEYPLSPWSEITGVHFDRKRFHRLYFTTGVVLSHPCFDADGVKMDTLASLLYEAFFMVLPFERRDVGIAVDKHRTHLPDIPSGSRFICLHDQTYGSLRLSGRLLERDVLSKVVRQMIHLTQVWPGLEVNSPTQAALNTLLGDVSQEPAVYSPGSQGLSRLRADPSAEGQASHRRIIRPGSRGIALQNENELFEVTSVFFSPKTGLTYKGFYPERVREQQQGVQVLWPVNAIGEIPGVTEFAWYDEETGDIMDEVPL
ncbi:MAG: DEAD/DEAH box helicase [Alicyclobacillus sp.]|nr:DEAD/DEAH box helicase [Alicyclobacillus sp.]